MNNKAKKWGLIALNGVLTLGASLTLGLLSFGGFYAIYPSITLGLTSFALATLYEGEIYNSNIANALKKLLTPNYYNSAQAKETLTAIIDRYQSDLQSLPHFFQDYRNLLMEIEALSNIKHPSKAQKKVLKKARKELKQFERYFADALFDKLSHQQAYALELMTFLTEIDGGKFKQQIVEKANQKKKLIQYGMYFSIITSGLFSLGSIYLILDSLTTLTFISLSVSSIVSLALVCGTAYGFLIYNSLSDMIWDESMNNWYSEVKDSIQNASPMKAALMTTVSVLLVGLGISLTLFTAGTWWTIAKNTKNLPSFLKRIPTFVTAGLIPLFNGAAALVFTLENTKSSVDQVMSFFKGNKDSTKNQLADSPKKTVNPTPIYQRLNPFNLAIYLLETPLKAIGFILHIGSIGVTTDRIPGVSEKVSAGMSMVSEGFEDFHYFVKGESEDDHHAHDHAQDLPSKIIKLVLSPLYILSVCWHYTGSQFTQQPVNFSEAWQHRFDPDHNPHDHESEEIIEDLSSYSRSTAWQQQSILLKLSDNEKRLKNNHPKASVFRNLQDEIGKVNPEDQHAKAYISDCLDNKSYHDALSSHRHFLHFTEQTTSEQVIAGCKSQIQCP